MPGANKPTAEFLNWLVPARADIQRSLLNLYNLAQGNDLRAEQLAIESSIHRLLVGAGFSLWRAVFQAQTDLSIEDNVKASDDFLIKLVHHNSIQYSSEQNSWSFGYYLNNAKYRIIAIYDRMPEPYKTDLAPDIETIRRGTPRSAGTKYSRNTWDSIYAVFERMSGMLAELLKGK